MTNNKTVLGPRLSTAAQCVRDGAVLCDVGTDHAKLPIFLVSNKIIKKAYATDINDGPIKTAEKNVAALGLSDSIKCIRTDGLLGTENKGISDVCICGMGGELIARILGDCEYIKNDGVRLILQPMTHTHDLRRFLYDSGFDITDEILCLDSKKLYVVICASFVGKRIDYDISDLYLGKILPNKQRDDLFLTFKEKVLSEISKKFAVKDHKLLEEYRDLYERIEKI